MPELKEKHLHIVSFNIPYPPDYGGVIEVFYKIKALWELGVKVHLHCYQYGRQASPELELMCESVHYYPRSSFYQSIFSYVPYIVGSRKSEDLLSNLVQDAHPVLFEGLHTCFYLKHPELKNRYRAVRMHNIEWDYYSHMGKAERNFFRKLYFYSEARKLKSFEGILEGATHIFAISPHDEAYLKEHYGKYAKVFYLPAFHQNKTVDALPGKGDYALYHANLAVVENHQAAVYLVQKVFKDLDIPLIIAGKDPKPSLIEMVEKADNVELKINISDDEMRQLIRNAHVNVLPTFQATGIKLKLLNALYQGRFCLVNEYMVKETGLESLCIIANDAEHMRQLLQELFRQEFTEAEILKRKELLYTHFSNEANARKIISWLFDE